MCAFMVYIDEICDLWVTLIISIDNWELKMIMLRKMKFFSIFCTINQLVFMDNQLVLR